MNRFIITIFFVLCGCSIIFGQSITIKGIEKDPTNLEARMGSKIYAPDGENWALIKFRTMEKGFQVDAGTVNPKVVYETGEVWIYVQPRTRFLTIAHDKFGKSNTLHISPPCESSTVYNLDIEMIAADGKNANIVYTKIASISVEPQDAMVYINDELHPTKMGEVQKKLEYGKYNLRVESNMYHSHQQQLVVDDNLQQTLKVRLTPNFGWLNITTTPEGGADVFVNNKLQSSKSPFKTESLTSGEYTVVVKKDLYNTATATATVRDGETTTLNIDMPANFAEVTIAAIEGADIYIDGNKVGTTNWKGRLADGVCSIEGRKDKHRTDTKSIKISLGIAQTIKLNPEPITGTLDIYCIPSGSDVKINGKSYGVTPQSINNMLVGNYEVILSKQGFGTELRQITVEEGKTTTVDVTLSTGKNITVTSTPSGATLYVDGKNIGITPQQLNLSYGDHTFKITDSKGKSTEQKASISEAGPSSYQLKTESNETFTVNGVSFTMIFVAGGTFEMGEEGIATPVHRVTLSSYCIGETEVTQALWESVMGSNPSNFSGANNPVEGISWDDCQDFIKKLNQLTGKKFRLPTEAEWEYAARGGNNSKGYRYSGSDALGAVAWYSDNSGGGTHAVKTKAANELGIYDMSGNVWEWCSDRYGSYSRNAQTNPTGPTSGSCRILRGGGWYYGGSFCRVPHRNFNSPDNRLNDYGVRVALVQ